MSTPHPTTPSEALEQLLTGNDRFVRGERSYPHQDIDRRASLASGQAPFAVVFGCSDSRLAAELLFDQGLGDLFVVRTAGHVAGAEVTGSIEYGAQMLGAPLVVVLGHGSCGAVTAAKGVCDGGATPGGHVRDVVERVTPSVLAAKADGIDTVDEIVDEHIKHTVDFLVERSGALAEAVENGTCAVVGLSYQLAEGSVRMVAARGPVPAPAA